MAITVSVANDVNKYFPVLSQLSTVFIISHAQIIMTKVFQKMSLFRMKFINDSGKQKHYLVFIA